MLTTRRDFLKAAGVGALVTVAGTKAAPRVLGANDRIRIAVAGLNGRGGSHVGEWSRMKGVEIAYLIDPDTRTYAKHLKTLAGKNAPTPKCVQDVRQALDDKTLDAISIATPNHWHALMTIWGCQAGKDVYVEKPASHNVHEGRIAVETARKYNRIVQHGTQSRSSPAWIAKAELAKSGKYGKLLISRGLVYKDGLGRDGKPGRSTRGDIGFAPTKAPPSELDFNIWLGPAPDQPYHENLVHYRWHWFWDFGNGDIGNQGVHQMDIARWMIPGATLPRSVLSLGGRFGYSDQGETPNTQIAVMDFGPTHLIFEVRGLPTDGLRGEKIGNILHFESGVVAGNKFYPKGAKEGQPLPKVEVKGGPPRRGNHFANFIDAMRSRKTEDLCADIEEGYLSAALCHLANVSYRLGELVPFNPRTKAFGDNKDAYETLARMEEHLSEANRIQLDGLKYRLGRRLTVGERGEALASDPQVRPLLTRNYRKPFEVPAKV
jgi:predicted dehydrogenase